MTIDPNSVNDYIASTGGDNSMAGKAALYEKIGLGKASDYLALGSNNAEANTALLKKLRGDQPSQLINTSTKSRAKTGEATSALDAALAQLGISQNTPAPDSKTTDTEGTDADPILQSLGKLQNTNDAATKSLIAATQAKYQNEKNKTNEQYGNYKAGLQELGIQTNAAQATPDLLMGHIQKAGTDQLDKIHELDAEESKAIMDANIAKESQDFKTLQAKMDYVKEIKRNKAQAIKDMYDNIGATSKAAAFEAHDIYDTMQSLDPADQEQYIQAVAQKFNIPVMSLVQALKDEKVSRETDQLNTENKQSILDKRNAPKSGSSSGKKVTVEDASNEIDQHIKPISEGGELGDDGYMDPYKWIKLRDTWIKNKLSKTTFDTLYKRYLNPESYTIAGFTKPKSDTSSSHGNLFD